MDPARTPPKLRHYKPLPHRVYILFLGCLPHYLGILSIHAALHRNMRGPEEWMIFTFGIIAILFGLSLWRYVIRPVAIITPTHIILNRFLSRDKVAYTEIEKLGLSVQNFRPHGKTPPQPIRIHTLIVTPKDEDQYPIEHFLPPSPTLQHFLDTLQSRSGITIKRQRL
ncbi:hypothetical protein FEM03_20850 [Phragmitibacter flavus]|uniref:Uncharacterized protein n=1 Tax=Phragmitibacter flavus TaxID=2576071 RepID=A0A5R8KA50_9BACT|nr:hypothetical protein [Phragmitibacter flavus]TLD68785.1 hypothetical protein FEM03_20850 [Phragmitibacter flavus]